MGSANERTTDRANSGRATVFNQKRHFGSGLGIGTVRDRPDMMYPLEGEGGHGKANVVGGLREFLVDRDMGGGSQKIQTNCGHHIWRGRTETTLNKSHLVD